MLVQVCTAAAQGFGPSLRGRVTDAATGAAIEYADVVVTDAENRTIASATVRNGAFEIDHVRDGRFVEKDRDGNIKAKGVYIRGQKRLD